MSTQFSESLWQTTATQCAKLEFWMRCTSDMYRIIDPLKHSQFVILLASAADVSGLPLDRPSVNPLNTERLPWVKECIIVITCRQHIPQERGSPAQRGHINNWWKGCAVRQFWEAPWLPWENFPAANRSWRCQLCHRSLQQQVKCQSVMDSTGKREASCPRLKLSGD